MIKYTLICDHDHRFDSWFQNAAAFDSLSAAGHVTCPTCGSAAVKRALMAPAVAVKSNKATAPAAQPEAAPNPAPTAPTPTPTAPDTAAPDPAALERALSEMRAQVEKNSDYVGGNFVKEARKMHEGEVEERSIYGEAKPEEAAKLIEDGIPVAPLPFIPRRKTN